MARRAPRPPHALKSNSPLRILTQIVLLQFCYYVSVTALTLFTALTAGRKFSPKLILDWRTIRGDTAMGWTMGVVWGVGGGLSGIILLLMLVARSKLVLDFVLTLHFLHLVVTSTYTRSVPANALWWLLQAGSIGVMMAGGMWSCRWRELRPMAFGGAANTGKTAGVNGGLPGAEAGGGPTTMLGGDEYEMVARYDPEDGRVREGRG